jgi:heme O synthase-like polyprenyltransferase
MYYREQYAAAGFRVLPRHTSDRAGGVVIVAWALAMIAVSLWPWAVLPGRFAGWYPVAALTLGVPFVLSAALLAVRPSRLHARLVFLVSVIYLPALFLLMVLDAAWPTRLP